MIALLNLFILLISVSFAQTGAIKTKKIKMGEPPKITEELLARGKVVFTTYCMRCHGEKGDGKGVAAKVINPKPRDFTTGEFKHGGELKEIFTTVSTGVRNTAMPAWGYLPEKDRWAVIYYVKTFNKNVIKK